MELKQRSEFQRTVGFKRSLPRPRRFSTSH